MGDVFKEYGKSILARLHVLPPIQRVISNIRNRGVDRRRFWKGEMGTAPSGNTPLFDELKKEPFTITHEKESRDCIFLDPKEEVTISFPKDPSLRLKLSFASEGFPALSEGIQVFDEERQVADIRYIAPHRWHHICLTPPFSSKIRVANNSSSRITLAHPILEYQFPQSQSSKTTKNILVLLLDSLSQDTIGPYNPSLAEYTPAITRFFQNALKYNQAFTQAEWTFPSIYSLFLSRYPIDHGMVDLKLSSPNLDAKKEKPLAMQLRNLGYTTLAYSTVKVSHPGFHAHLGFDRFFYDPFPQATQTHQAICKQAIMQLQGNPDGKNFLFLHFLDTHEPFRNPSELEESLLSNFRITDPAKEYEANLQGYGDTKAEPHFDQEAILKLDMRRNVRLKEIDSSLQMLFDYLEKSMAIEETTVILFSDHGYLYNAGKQPLLCDNRLHVPFLIRNPGMKSGVSDDLVALNVDLAPTILNMAGGQFTGGDGYIMSPFGDKKRSSVISESIFGNLYKVAIRDEKYVYHYSCAFDRQTRKIQVNDMRSQMLFERSREAECQDICQKASDKRERMHRAILDHLKKFPKQICLQ